MNEDFMGLEVNSASFNTELGRLRTFNGWINPAVRPEDLAKAGFVYVTDDKVQCVYCQGVLGNWEAGDVPLEEHRKFFPNCPLVKNGTANTSLPVVIRGSDVAGTGLPPKPPQVKKKSVIYNKNIISHHASKHPEYGSLDSRVQSFDSWPWNASLSQNAKCMAEAGFYYTGTTDYVLCFHCGQGLKEWEGNDDPWEEHARWHPTCELILLKRGQIYVEKAKIKGSIAEENKGHDLKTGHHSKGETSKTADDNEDLTEFMKFPESQEILSMGIDRSEIARTIRNRQKNFQMADIVIQLLKYAKMKKVNATLSQTAGNDSGSPTNPDEVMMQELRSCIVCTVQERCITFLPCAHFSACTDCTLLLKDCPVCRQQIDSVVKTYMS